MPLDLLRSAPQHKTTFWDAKPSFCTLLGLASIVLLASLAVPFSEHLPLQLSAFSQLCAIVRCCLLRRYIFIAVNLMLFVILKLWSKQRDEETPEGGACAGAGELFPYVRFDAVPSPTFRENCEPPSASSPPVSATELSPEMWFDAQPPPTFCDDVATVNSTEQPPASSPPVPTTAVSDIKRSEKEPAPPSVEDDHDDDSMDATWKAITGSAHLKKSNTWDAPPPVQVESAARGGLRKSETFREEAAAAAARRAVLEKRMKGKEVEVEVAADYDVMNRRFEAFINKFNEQLRLQRYTDIVYNAGY